MSLSLYPAGRTPEEIVRSLLDALGSGRVLDALDAFALDAVIRDARGREHRGIREIADFVNRVEPESLRTESIRQDHGAVTAVVRSRNRGREERRKHTY